MTLHTIASVPYPKIRSGLPVLLTCSCSFSIEVAPQLGLPEPWSPVLAAWKAHRDGVGATGDTQAGGRKVQPSVKFGGGTR